jgi:hypothetical protein
MCNGNSSSTITCCNTNLDNIACCQNNNNTAPCSVNCGQNNGDGSSQENEYDQLIGWFSSLAIYQLVLVILAFCIVLIVLLWICCVFGNHKPPVKYEYIIGKYS